jgi:hypothetical protein
LKKINQFFYGPKMLGVGIELHKHISHTYAPILGRPWSTGCGEGGEGGVVGWGGWFPIDD